MALSLLQIRGALIFVLTCAPVAGEAAGVAGRGSPHLKYMSYYGFNPALMHGWVNMGLEAGPSLPGPAPRPPPHGRLQVFATCFA